MKLKLSLLAVFFCSYLSAQSDSIIKAKTVKGITNRFPSTRLFDLQYQQYLPTDFDSELYDLPFEEGQIQNHYRFSASANLPIIMKPKWNITTSLRYRYEAFELKDVKNSLDNSIPAYSEKLDYHYLSGALSFTYFSRIFNKPFIYNASVIVDGTEKDAQRIKGFFGANIILKKTERTTIGVGLLVLVDPTSPVPATPTFMWEHKFKDSPWTMDFILPQRLLFKRHLFGKARLSLGSELNTSGFYIDQSALSNVYDYRNIEINSGLTYEHLLAPSVIASFRAGLATIFNSRISVRGENTNDYIYSNNQDGTAYFSLGFSFNPSPKKKK